MARSKTIDGGQRTKLHDDMNETIKHMREIMSSFLESGVRLSRYEHRGSMCKTCRRPTANNKAEIDLTREGDGPDLCWGNCSSNNRNC